MMSRLRLEANPTSVEADRFRGYYDAGVNRVSLGVQSLREDDLKRLGRLHSVDEARHAIELAQSVFPRVSFDLIYGRQDQSIKEWESELQEALSIQSGHMSLYQLTIEQGTAFGDRYNAGKLRGLPDEDLSADMYELTQSMCQDAGLPAYEISNHAAEGLESRHNLIYWNYGDYAGIGPGAHGRLTLNGQKHAIDTPLQPTSWLKQVSETGNGDRSSSPLAIRDQFNERLMMGLRTVHGVSLDRLGAEIDDFNFKVNDLQDYGLLEITDNHLRTTQKGRPLLNALLRELLVN